MKIGKPDALALRDNVENHLMQIKTIEESIDYLNEVTALEKAARTLKKDNEILNLVVEQKIRSMRHVGKFIKKGQEDGEIAKPGKNKNIPNKYIKKLSDIGITANESSRYQKIADLPDDKFEETFTDLKEDIKCQPCTELTSASFFRKITDNNTSPRTDKADSFDKSKLILLREQRNVKQFDVSMESGVETGTISRLESGDAKYPSFDTVARLAEYFNVPMEYFKTGNLL